MPLPTLRPNPGSDDLEANPEFTLPRHTGGRKLLIATILGTLIAIIGFVNFASNRLAESDRVDASKKKIEMYLGELLNRKVDFPYGDFRAINPNLPVHPAIIKRPWPTRAQVESTVGKADFEFQSEDGTEETLLWLERATGHSVWTPLGSQKDRHCYFLAHFDKQGRLKAIDVQLQLGYFSEHVERDIGSWILS